MSTTTSMTDVKGLEANDVPTKKEFGEKVEDQSSDLGKDQDLKDPTTGEPELEYATGFQFVCVIAALMLNVFLVALDQTIVATAIPKITDQFKDLSQVGWYASAYFMTFGGFQSTWGKLFKYFPLKVSFIIAILLFEVGSLICGVAPNSTTLIAGRAVAGLGAAGIATGAFLIVALAIEPKVRPMYTGMIASMYGVSAIAGPLLGGVFSDKVTWRWCFYINLPIGGLVGALILIFFKTPPQAKPTEATLKEKIIQLDLIGAALVMGGLISFILAMQWGGQTKAWSNSDVIGLLVGFGLMTIVFIGWEIWLGERAMVIPRLFTMRSVWVGAWFQFFFGASYFILLYYLPIYFQSVDGVSPIGSGVRNLPMIVPVVFASTAGGIFISKTGLAAPIAVGGSILATICAGLLYSLDIGSSAGKWIGYQIIGGVGWGGAWTCSIVILQAYAKPEDMSAATAINLFLQILGGAFGIAGAQAAFVNKVVSTLARTAPNVNPLQVIGTGATQIRTDFPAEAVPGIIRAYMDGVKVAFAIAIALAGCSFVLSLFLEFKRLPANRAAGAMAA